MKKFFLFLIFFGNFSQASELKLRWFGTTFFILESEKSALLFDPFISRPELSKLIFFDDLEPNTNEFNKWIPKSLQKKIEGIFVSHSHYDHVLDLELAVKENQAVIYGSKSTGLIAKTIGISKKKIKQLRIGKKLEIGDFFVTALEGKHPAHLFGMTLADGKIEDFKYPSTAYGYKTGEVYTFIIEYKGEKIYFAPSGIPVWKKEYSKVDILIQGISNKKSYEDIVEKQVLPSRAKLLIPAHYDDFLTMLSNPPKEISTANLKEFLSMLKTKEAPSVLLPKYGDEIVLIKN